MADYKETTVNGTAWQRAQLIIMSNPNHAKERDEQNQVNQPQ